MARPRIGISSCLLGEQVRYDGAHKRVDGLEELEVEWVPVCPEVEVGMGVPREPVDLVRAGPGVPLQMVGQESGRDWTDAMKTFARERLAVLEGICGWVFKSRSPSCGLNGIRVHGPRKDETTAGLFAAAVEQTWPGLPTVEEGALQDAERRAGFLARVRVYQSRQGQGQGQGTGC